MKNAANSFAAAAEADDTFSSLVLKCQRNPDFDRQMVLNWNWPASKNSGTISRQLWNVLVPDGKQERGMFCTKSKSRIQKMHRICEAEGVNIRMALSYRRQVMQQWNPSLSLSQLQLGTGKQARRAAHHFEMAVQDYLRQENVTFYNKEAQNAHFRWHRQPGQRQPPTPDFVLKVPIRIGHSEVSVNWIDVKSYYAFYDEESRLMQQTRKYVNLYGPGAIIFMHGCCDYLARELVIHEQVLALDSSNVDGIKVSKVDAYMRSYCGAARGEVLP